MEDLKRQEGHQADTFQDILLQIGGIGPPPSTNIEHLPHAWYCACPQGGDSGPVFKFNNPAGRKGSELASPRPFLCPKLTHYHHCTLTCLRPAVGLRAADKEASSDRLPPAQGLTDSVQSFWTGPSWAWLLAPHPSAWPADK